MSWTIWFSATNTGASETVAFRIFIRTLARRYRESIELDGFLPAGAIQWCNHETETSKSLVGVTGFEPATSWSQTKRTSQAVLHPAELSVVIGPLSLVNRGSPPTTNDKWQVTNGNCFSRFYGERQAVRYRIAVRGGGRIPRGSESE